MATVVITIKDAGYGVDVEMEGDTPFNMTKLTSAQKIGVMAMEVIKSAGQVKNESFVTKDGKEYHVSDETKELDA